MNTERFVKALRDYDLDPTEIADILWLALRQPQDRTELPPEEPPPEEPPPPVIESDLSRPEDSALDDLGETAPEASENEPTFDIASQAPSGQLPHKALPISVPDARFLGETLPLVRALKPVLKQVDSATARQVNESATVDRIAETDIWSPVMQVDREPWFDVALVIDGSASMSLWRRLIEEVQRLLRCYGSFRDLRVWELVYQEGQVGVCALPDHTMRSPKTLLPPDNRRLTLVFSDCTADYWWNGSLQPILAQWGAAMPTTVWQVLPDWMWKRTALGVGDYVVIRNRIPGATNQELRPVYLSLRPRQRRSDQPAEDDSAAIEPSPGPAVCVPVITADQESLIAWSRMVAGDRRQPTPGFVLPARGWEHVRDRPDNESDERLEQFRRRATPEARRLAALLSAAPVITLPVMRLIRTSMMPGTSPLPVAEVFLSSLLRRSANQPMSTDPELIQYDFPTETRDRLLGILPPVEGIAVIDAVSHHVAERLNYTLADFKALLLSPDLKEKADEHGLRTFARVTAQILRRLGREYADLAAQFEFPQAPGPSEVSEWPDFPLEDFEYEVAQYLNLPPLETFNFNDAQLEDEDDLFPPSLETEDFTIVTFEPQDDTPELEPFSFIVATVRRRQGQQQQTTEWEIFRETREAYRFLEPLPGIPPLEMVTIPGGTFLMGSPEDEPQRSSRESPQHEVTVAPFFMGAYPVTQRQWRVVAELPQIERELEPDLSRFKGPDRPVEQVSWLDSIEFCARLSDLTGRQYRLPTEAEWEYACRAATTTPFHFGETLTAELANYRANSTYNGGPEGEYREETTSIDHFGIANAFGLSDMHGNVLEWCQDHWHDNYDGAPTDGSAWIEGGDESYRVLRGGSWLYNPGSCRSAFRDFYGPGSRDDGIGFRVCCSAPRTLTLPTD
jgi:formylglycine-generating enzyme required for sulfatase activity